MDFETSYLKPFIFKKHSDWKYEQELRIMVYDSLYLFR